MKREVTTEPHDSLRRAIAERRLVSFRFKGCRRIGEPHDYGIKDGVARLFFYQTGGESRSKPATGWRWADLDGMSELEILAANFTGPRAAPSGRHVAWDKLIASVSAAQRAAER